MNSTDSSLASFAAQVLTALASVGSSQTERFGHRKVFVSALARKLGIPVAELAAFKARLIYANREGLLELARADLVGAMPATAVVASEIRSLGSEFHFVIDPAAREPWECAAA